jgi:hypothetical protein
MFLETLENRQFMSAVAGAVVAMHVDGHSVADELMVRPTDFIAAHDSAPRTAPTQANRLKGSRLSVGGESVSKARLIQARPSVIIMLGRRGP